MKNKRNNSIADHLIFWTVTYWLHIVLCVCILFLRRIGYVNFLHRERASLGKGPLLIVANHPSLWEPWLMPGLFFPRSVLHPYRHIPWCTPDPHTYDRWYLFFLRPRSIPIPRDDKRGSVHAFHRMVDILQGGERIVLFPEGGRTNRGDTFRTAPNNARIREPKHGMAQMVLRTHATVLPIWVAGAERVLPVGALFPRFWHRTTMVVGKPIVWQPDDSDEKIHEQVIQTLLALSCEVI